LKVQFLTLVHSFCIHQKELMNSKYDSVLFIFWTQLIPRRVYFSLKATSSDLISPHQLDI